MSFEMVQESAIVGGSCSDVWNLMKSFEFKWQSNITTVKPGDIDKASREELIFKLTFDDKLELYANILDISGNPTPNPSPSCPPPAAAAEIVLPFLFFSFSFSFPF